MQSCPNISSLEWKQLVSVVGEMEAYRDFMTHGTIRDVASVLMTVKSRTGEETAKIQGATSIIEGSILDINNAMAAAGLHKLAGTLSDNLGVTYSTISVQDAQELLQEADTQYNGEAAFTYQGKVYFVNEILNKDMVLHEFAHPLVTAVRLSNPTLFSKLADEAMSLPGMSDIIKERYSDQSIESQQEEAIVRGMLMAEDNSGFWKRIAYALKQLLRKVFGKQVKVNELSKNTTLADLFKMMQTEEFDIKFVDSSNDNVVNFIREQKTLNDFLANEASSPKIEVLLEDLRKLNNYATRLVEDPQVEESIGEFLETEDGRFIFDELARELSKFQQYNQEAEKYIKNEKPMPNDLASLVITRNLAVLSNTLSQIDTLLSNLGEATYKLSSDPTQAELIETQAIFKIVQAVQIWTGSLDALMSENKVPAGNEVRVDVGRLGTTAKEIESEIRGVFKEFAIDFLYEENADIREQIEGFYNQRLEQLEKEKAAGKNVDRDIKNLKKKYSQKVLTKENLRKVLSGELGDANIAGSMMENFLQNPDPVIGGFASWYRKAAYKTQSKMQAQTNDFIKSVLPILKEAGYNPNNPQAFFRQLMFLDTTVRNKAAFDEDLGTDIYQLEEYQVWTLLNPYKNYLSDKKVLQEKIEKAQRTDDIKTLQDLYQQRDEMDKNFFRRYTKEYYDAFEEYATPTGKIARQKLDDLYNQLRQIDDKINGYDPTDVNQDDFIEKKLILREIRQLYSEVDIYGKKKKGEDLEVAQLLKRVREKSKDFYEFKEIPGLFDIAYNNFLETIQHVEFGSAEYDTLVNEWLESNTQVAVTDDFFELEQSILTEIEEIQKLLGMESSSVKEMYKVINDISKGFRDSVNEVEATAITEEAQKKVKDIQQKLLDFKAEMRKLNGLTQEESDRLTDLLTKKNEGGVNMDELREIRDLFNKKKALGKDPALLKRLYTLYAELRDLRQTEPTQYYVDAISAHLSRIKSEGDIPGLFSGAFPTAEKLILNKADITELMDNQAFINTMMQDKEFSQWYNRNHVFDKKKGEYLRTALWNVKRPTDNKFYKTMTLPTGEEIMRVPNRTFQERIVKDEYVTERVIGETIDVWGNYLPDLSVSNNPYRNDEYFKLKKENPSMFKALDALSQWHLSKQEGLNVSARLGYQIPRFRPDTLERAQELSKRGAVGKVFDDVKEKFMGAVDDIQSGYNFDQKQLATFGIINDDLSEIPIYGVAKLDSPNVSLNVMDSILRYNSSALYQEMLIETSPIARMLIDVVDDERNALKDLTKVDRQMLKRTGQMVNKSYGKISKYDSVRSMALNAFYEREYLGKVHAETFIDRGTDRQKAFYRAFQKTTGLAMRFASTSFFAVNIPSALKNRFAAVLQNNIEAVAGDVLTSEGFLKGKVTAKTALSQISSTIYSDKVKGKHAQITQVFDIDGQLDKQRGAVSRTFSRDAVSMSWLFSPRKLLQMDGTLELLYGMLHSKVIELKDGSKVTLADALEIKDGQLQVRPDTKEDWSLTSDNFVKFRILFQGKMNRLQGTYDQIDQPLFSRYLLGRTFLFLRKYFISMFMHRFAAQRIQYDTRQMEEGYYRSGLKFLYNLGKAFAQQSTQGGTFEDFNRNTALEKQGFKRMSADILQQMVLLTMYKALMKVLFGYDPESDDEDERKTKLLRSGSGALPLPMTNSKYDFNPVGWFQLHAINQMMQVHQEAATFSPVSLDGSSPGFTSILEMVQSPVSAIFTPTVARANTVVGLLQKTATGDRGAYYTRDVGPWMWQQQGANKAAAETLKFIGLNGKTVDPANAIVQWQQGQKLRKR